jgi:hypothetical protein
VKTRTLVYLRIGFYSTWALAGVWGTAMAGVKWNAMGWEEASCLIAGMVLNWTAIMMAFFDKSVWKLDEEQRALTK